MQRLDRRSLGPAGSVFRGVALAAAAIAWIGAAAMGAVVAVFFAATVLVVGLMASALLALSAAALKARRTTSMRRDPSLLEARNVGGHSWVAYGWDGRS